MTIAITKDAGVVAPQKESRSKDKTSPPPKRRPSSDRRIRETTPPSNDPQKSHATEGLRALYEAVGEAERHYRSFLDFLKFVENRDEIADDATFSRILHHALTEFPISQSALSQRLGYANSQIGRWMTGRAAPHVLVRPQVIEVLAAMLEEALEDLRSNNRSIVQAFDIKDGFSRKGETH